MGFRRNRPRLVDGRLRCCGRTSLVLVAGSRMRRLIFSRVSLEIFEDTDYPGDPAPYVRIASHDPEFMLELEEAADLGRALLEWVRELEERERRRERDLRREGTRLDNFLDTLPPDVTLLELLRRSRPT